MKKQGVIKRDLGNGDILSPLAFEGFKHNLINMPVRSVGVTIGRVTEIVQADRDEALVALDAFVDLPPALFRLEPGCSFDKRDIEVSEDDEGNIVRIIDKIRQEYVALSTYAVCVTIKPY